jgi:hypothetical protein
MKNSARLRFGGRLQGVGCLVTQPGTEIYLRTTSVTRRFIALFSRVLLSITGADSP